MADRAVHVNPGLVIVLLPNDVQRAYSVMREVSGVLSVHVLAVGPADDPQLILRTLHEGGAHEYLDRERLEDEIAAAMLRFRSRCKASPAQESTGRVVSVVSFSGGSGCSTVAVNLAVILASQHRTCGLIDLGLSTGDLAPMLDIQPRYGLADLCTNLDRLDRQMFEQFFEPHASGVHLLAAPHDPSQAHLVSPRGVRQSVAMARAHFPFVLIDLANALDEEQLEAVWQSDLVLAVLRLDYTSVRNTRRMLEHLRQKGLDPDRLRPIANRVGERNQLSIAEVEKALGRKVFDQSPSEPPRMNAAMNAGVPVVLHRPRARVARRLSALAARIAQHPVTNSNRSAEERPWHGF
jgi:pilus assembly protein CpaE